MVHRNWIYVLTSLWTLAEINAEDLAIGVIQDGPVTVSRVERRMYNKFNVTWIKHVVDMGNTFQVFRAVRQLDSDDDIDIVVILHHVKLSASDDHVMMTSHRPLILWGRTPFSMLQVPFLAPTATTDRQCPVIRDGGAPYHKDYCFVGLAEVISLGNGALLEKVSLTVAKIVGTLVARSLHWTSVYIFHDNSTEMDAHALLKQLSAKGVLSLTYNVDVMNDVFDILLKYIMTLGHLSIPTSTALCCVSLNVSDVYFGSQGLRTTLAGYEMLREEESTHGGPIAAVSRRTHNGTLLEYVTDTLKMQSSKSRCAALKIETLMWREHGREFSNVGYVTTDGDVVTFSDLFPNTKYGYNKRRFLIATLHYPPFVKKSMVNGKPVYDGLCMDLLKELSLNLNFTYNLTEPPDGKWGGTPGPNLTFNGMIGQLQREEIDMVAADMSVQKEREQVMDFAYPYMYAYTSVILKKPDPNAGKWKTLLNPLQYPVLVAIGVVLPVVTLLAFLFEKYMYNPFFQHAAHAQLTTSDPCRINTLQTAFWYMCGALLCQGGVNLPMTLAGRTFASCWLLFCLSIVATYCGNLVAFLTVTKVKAPFNTLQEMTEMKDEYKWGTMGGTHWEHVLTVTLVTMNCAHLVAFLTATKVEASFNTLQEMTEMKDEYKWGTMGRTLWEHVLTSSTQQDYRKVGDLAMEFNRSDPEVMSPYFDVHLAKVKKGGYGWIGDMVIIEIEMAKDCDLMMIKEKCLPLKYAFGFTNNSPHAKIFSKQMLSIVESGLLDVWKRRWWPKASLCQDSATMIKAKPISLVDVQSAFYVVAGGGVVATLVFFVELLAVTAMTACIIYQFLVKRFRD